MLSLRQKIIKRIFDIFISIIGIVIFIIPIFLLICTATIIHKEFGVFTQKRVGKGGELFTLYKIKSMKIGNKNTISSFGSFIRKYKLDELPQFFNVLLNDMSIVGPRPDIIGYADKLTGNDMIILSVKPGLTSNATILFSNEEVLLKKQINPLKYNNEVLWPQKVKLNREYVENYSFSNDLKIIFKTIKTII